MPKIALALLAALVLAPAAQGGQRLYVGAAEDAAKDTNLVVAKAKMNLATLAGFGVIRLTAVWSPGKRQIAGNRLVELENATAAADLTGIRVVLSVYPKDSKSTPVTPRARANFAAFAASLARNLPTVHDFIVGNEPNLNLFWMPQFTRAGASASPAAYLRLLARTYDSLKAVSPQISVVGGSVSPRGGDNPALRRHTHSPTRFIRELGRAYRASRRKAPIMDAFSFHPYGESSSVRPDFRRSPLSTSIGLSEYDRLVGLLREAFDGTAQQGSTLPIVYDEYGVDTRIPRRKARRYVGREHRTTRPVTEAAQAAYYRRALAMAACQPNVRMMLFFHVTDEPDLRRWQSGVFYADDTPKSSLRALRRAAADARAGRIANCRSWPDAARWAQASRAPNRRR